MRIFSRSVTFQILSLAISGLFLVWLSRDGRLDFFLARLFFDSSTASFPLRDTPLLSIYGHTWLKNMVNAIWLASIGLAMASLRNVKLQAWRAPLWRFVLFAGSAALLIQQLKAHSAHACPWSLVQFGGDATWFPLFDTTAVDESGNCWPGGHASAGYVLIAAWFAARDRYTVLARGALAGGLILGSLMGLIQMMRGAHFLTHNLWTLWLVWSTCFALDLLYRIGAMLLSARSKTTAHSASLICSRPPHR
ncbi:phosphatase PAP2 family protein [Oxalicibacterium flavum]|uniref:phosphatase PAP2 family protein n=1 Tax=Oxalicibacterium flavum TaxID=179467 RepID=UPI00166F19C0|nr:phosphatase PAP2 family protein [Oxalicibacterium flavum]